MATEIRVLDRVLRWTAWRTAYEADPWHAELLIQALSPCASLRTTPGLKPTSSAPGDQSPLSLWPRRGSTEHARPGQISWLWIVWMWHLLRFAAVSSLQYGRTLRPSGGWPSTSWECPAWSGILCGSRRWHSAPMWIRTTPSAM